MSTTYIPESRAYIGTRVSAFNVQVHIDEGGYGEWLPHVGNHGAAFEWGSDGAGPADLAWSVLAHHLEDHQWYGKPTGKSERLHQKFKEEVIAKLPRGGFRLKASEVQAWLDKQG